MNEDFKALWTKAEGRYLTDLEAEKLVKYGHALRIRMGVMAAVERAEPAILDHVWKGLTRSHPSLRAGGAQLEAKLRRDNAYVLRYATSAMVLMSTDFILDKLSYWLRTILNALVDIDQVTQAFRLVREGAEQQLTPQQFALLRPYLDAHISEFESALKEVA